MFLLPDLDLTSNQAYHAAAILFFLHPELPDKFPQTKDALHAGWMACFKHPMNFEELRRPPCVGASAYTDEEQKWCSATLQYLVDSLDPAGRLARGIQKAQSSAGFAAAPPPPPPAPSPTPTPGPPPGPVCPWPKAAVVAAVVAAAEAFWSAVSFAEHSS